jgi:hypothetical protein
VCCFLKDLFFANQGCGLNETLQYVVPPLDFDLGTLRLPKERACRKEACSQHFLAATL